MGEFYCKLITIVGLLFLNLKLYSCSEFYSLTAKDIKGNEVSMENYRGKVVLIVNVASKCGFTDVNYKELVELRNQFPKGDLAILAFPCNQFGKQEPKRNSGIYRFARDNYGVNFDMFSKIKVVGEGTHPIYEFLFKSTQHSPVWNFNKYLVNRAGFVVRYWSQGTNPRKCLKTIDQYVNPALSKNFETFSVHGSEL